VLGILPPENQTFTGNILTSPCPEVVNIATAHSLGLFSSLQQGVYQREEATQVGVGSRVVRTGRTKLNSNASIDF